MAYITLKNIPEIIIENILVESSKNNEIEVLVTSNNKPNSLISKINSTNKGFLINLTEPNTKKIKKSKASLSKKHKALDNNKDSNNKKTKDKKTSSNKENSNYNKGN
jgi:predicted double-glycine peptidase